MPGGIQADFLQVSLNLLGKFFAVSNLAHPEFFSQHK